MIRLIDLANPADRTVPLSELKKYECVVIRNLSCNEGNRLRFNQGFEGEFERTLQGEAYVVCRRAS